MTREEFFKLSVGDEIYSKDSNITYKLFECVRKPHLVENLFRNIKTGNFISMNVDSYWFSSFIERYELIEKLSPVERVDKKISELKDVLAKWEAKEKSLEIQPGKFYEIVFTQHFQSGVYFVENRIAPYHDKNYFKYALMNNHGCIFQVGSSYIKSFKQITDISVLEKAWENV